VEGANQIPAFEVAFQRLQQSAQPLRSALGERNDSGELRDLSLPGADTAGGLRPGRRCQLPFEIVQTSLQRSPAQLGRVGVELSELLNFLLDSHALQCPLSCCCLHRHRSLSFRLDSCARA
jgi:hypothetical protein